MVNTTIQMKNKQKLNKVTNESKRECKSKGDIESTKSGYTTVDKNQAPSLLKRILDSIWSWISSHPWIILCIAILILVTILWLTFVHFTRNNDETQKLINEIHLKEYPSLAGIVHGNSTMKLFGCTGTFILRKNK